MLGARGSPSIFDLPQQLESSDDDVSRRLAQAACDSNTSGSDHAVEDGSGTEESVRCDFLDSMAVTQCACGRLLAREGSVGRGTQLPTHVLGVDSEGLQFQAFLPESDQPNPHTRLGSHFVFGRQFCSSRTTEYETRPPVGNS